MGIKSREPDQLKHSDYVSWYLEFIDLRGRLIASGEWPMHLDVDFTALHTAFKNAYADYEAKRQFLVKTATPAHDDAAKKVYLRIRSLKQLLPTLFGQYSVKLRCSVQIRIERGQNRYCKIKKENLY